MSEKPRILVVDDDPAVLQLFSHVLRSEGYGVYEAASAGEGLRLTREHHPALLLLDVQLPDLGGLDLCKHIKADPTLEDVFVVLVSGQAIISQDKVEGLAMGADDYVTKPVPPAELLARIRTWLRLRNTTVALRTSERHYRQLVEVLPDAFAVVDPQGRLLAVNPQAAAMLGYSSADELQQQSIFDLSPAEAHPRIEAELAHTLETGVLRKAEYGLLKKNGARLAVEVNAATLKDARGRPQSLVCVVRDVTERQRIEADLRLMADAVQSANVLICITDPENRFTFANEAFLATYGYTLAEILGRTPAFLQSAKNPPGLGDRIYRETMQGGWRGEMLNCRKDGSELPIALSTAQIKNNEGKILGLVGMAQNITQRKRMERRSAAFSLLAHMLGAANDAAAAADIILDVASDLFGWDASYVHLYSPERDEIMPVLTMDTISGQRSVVHPSSFTIDPSPLMRMVMVQGARLTDRAGGHAPVVPHLPFGAKDRCSACLMHVPIHSCREVIGILSIQSYTPHAYNPGDLKLLQALADHCGDSLHRIGMTAALREAEAKYRSIVENAVEGIFQSTPAGCYLSVNPAMVRILGYQTPGEVVQDITDIARQIFVRPERRQEFKRAIESAGTVEAFESEHHRKDGTRFWISVNARVVRDATGGVLYYEGTARDVTERKWAEQLRRVQRDFGIFLSSINELKPAAERLLTIALQHDGIDCGAVYLVDARTNTLELVAHEGLAPLTERDFAEDQVARPGPGTSMADLVSQFAQAGLRAREIIPLQHKGRVVAVLGIGSHLVAEIPPNSLHAIDAITAMAGGAITRIHAEQSLQANQQLLEKALHGLRAAVFILDAEPDSILECNPAATRIFGYSREEMLGRPTAFLHLNDEMREQFRRQLVAAVGNQGALDGFEHPMKRKDGTVLPAEHHMMPIKDRTGRVVNWVCVVRDLTAVKRNEEELRAVSRRIIEAQETERQRVARELHDGAIQIIATAKLKLRSVEDNVGAQNPAARLILARCSALLVQALEENRRIAHDLRPLDLDQLGLAPACRNLGKEFQARTGLNVNCHIGRQIPRLPPAVELNLFRIVQEALNNVEKHARARAVTLRLALQNGTLFLKICDDGRGFDPIQSQLKKRRWLGIGITNMRERAALLGGTWELKSAPHRGTTITVSVPFKHNG